MPYYLTSDTFADDPTWEVLAEGKRALIDALQASHQRLMSKASHTTSNGYLTDQAARDCATSRRVLTLLTTSVLDQPPKLHTAGDECECLGDEWTSGYTYRLHGFLKRNPSRREYERNREQKADLRDSALKQRVYERDGGACRYCRSGVLGKKSGRNRDRRKVLQYDHIDPDQPAGTDGANLVVSCARCNEYKGHRTPAESDMVLLPVPTDAEKAAWITRGPAVFDLPADQQRINDESPTNHRSTTDRDAEPNSDHTTDPVTPENDHTTADACPEQAEHDHEQRSAGAGKGPGWVGHPPVPDPPGAPPTQPARSPAEPDIYHRRSRAPATSPPLLGGTP